MRKSTFFRFALFGLALVGSNSHADQEGWTTQTTKDGKITVQSKVSSIKDAKGDEFPVVDYRASTIATANFSKCVALLLDVSKHKAINDDALSETVETLSDHEWILHYDLNTPWPLPKSDCISKMTYTGDSAQKTATFVFTAAPTRWKATSARRMAIYDLTYHLKDLGSGRIELTSVGRGSPPFKVPLWMVRAGLPGSISDPLARIVKLSGSVR